MSWLSSLIQHNANIASPVGNFLKDASPLAALIPGIGPLAAAGVAGLGSELGDALRHGGTIGGPGTLRSALTNASLSGGISGLRSAFAPSSSATSAMTGSGTPAAQAATTTQMPGMAGITGPSAAPLSSVAMNPNATMAALQQGGGGSSMGSLARGFGSFARDNPIAIGLGFQGLGQMSQAGSENRLRNAQADQLAYMDQLQRNRDKALEPLRQALAGRIGQMLGNQSYLPNSPGGYQGGYMPQMNSGYAVSGL